MPAPSTVFLVETLLLFISAILSCHGHTHQHSISPPLLMADPAIPSAVRVAFTLESPLLMDTPHLLLTFSFNSSLCKSSPPLTGLVIAFSSCGLNADGLVASLPPLRDSFERLFTLPNNPHLPATDPHVDTIVSFAMTASLSSSVSIAIPLIKNEYSTAALAPLYYSTIPFISWYVHVFRSIFWLETLNELIARFLTLLLPT